MNPFKMQRIHLLLCGLTTALALSSCSAPMVGGGGSTHDAMGHRPGPQGFRTVVIDAGHGGKDSGAVSPITGMKEKDLTLDTARRLRAELGGQFRVVMMRDSDEFIDLDDRAARASRVNDGILISIHYNKGPGYLSGVETFYWRVDSYSLAKRAQAALSSVSHSSNRGLVRRRLRLTRNAELPSFLVECGYLSNAVEARRLADPGYRQQIAKALASAIRAQASMGDAGSGPLPPPINAPLSRPTDAPE